MLPSSNPAAEPVYDSGLSGLEFPLELIGVEAEDLPTATDDFDGVFVSFLE